jgi:hypothetical protein
MKAKKLGGFPSQGMVLCGSNADHTAVELVDPPAGAEIGERVTFEGHGGDFCSPAQLDKKKVFQTIQPGFTVNDKGEATWNGVNWQTSAGVCTLKTFKTGTIS